MKHYKIALPRSVRDLCRDRKGAAAILFAAMVPAALGVAGLTVDVGRALSAKRALEAGTQAAALAGAYALASPSATSSTVGTAITNWNTANPISNLTLTSSTPALSCVTSTSNLPSCNDSSPNVVSVTQTASVPTYFLKAIGRDSFTLTSTVSAAKAGGNAQSLNVMFVLDATGSMGDADSNCTNVPGFNDAATSPKKTPTRFQCALYSIQSVLKVMPTSLDKVGLMVFPGMGTQYSPTSHPCSTQPNSVKYLTTNIKYQIHTTLDNTYNDGAGSLVTTSPMVQAIGNYKTSSSLSPCVTNKGGQGSYAAEVIAKAQAAMPAVVTGTQNVIIFLSDGGFNADSDNFATGYSAKATNQCKQAVEAAQAATTAGTKVYSVAYGASTATSGSDSCSTESGYSPKYTACTAMQAIASDTGKFYTTNSTCSIAGSANPVTKLPDVFQAITTTLTKPRLIAN